MTLTKAEKAEREERKLEALRWLKKLCPPGKTVYTSCDHVSRSGMTRRIRLFVVDRKADEIQGISSAVAAVLGYRQYRDGALIVRGCGMDMGYHLVHGLSLALHGREDRGEGVEPGSVGRPFHNPRPGHYRSGYSLKHRWL